MKKYLFTILVAGVLSVGTGSAYGLTGNAETLSPSGLENLAALSNEDDGDHGDGSEDGNGGANGSDPRVLCYCRMDKPAICSAKGTGPFCGYDPCISHDTNCR